MAKRARPRPSLVVILDLSAATVTLTRLGKHHTYCKCNDDITPPCHKNETETWKESGTSSHEHPLHALVLMDVEKTELR